MKRVYAIIIMLLYCVALSACNHTAGIIEGNPSNDQYPSGNLESKPSNEQYPSGNIESNPSNEQYPSVIIETPPDDYSYYFDSYEDLLRALTTQSETKYLTLREEQVNYGKVYINTLSAFAVDDIKVSVPQYDGKNIDLRDKEGYYNVTLMTCELYNLPWLWYSCVIDDIELDVKIAFPSVLNSLEIEKAKTYYEVLTLIAPSAPSPANYQKYESYKNIYEKEIILADGKTVTAMVSELKNSSKVYFMFYLDGMLISLRADNRLFTDAFWNLFDVNQYK